MEDSTSPLQNKKVLIAGGVLLGVVLILMLATTLVKNRKQGGQAANGDKVLATVGDKKIYANDVKNQATKQYGSAAEDPKVAQSVLDKEKKRAIMDIEASKANIQVTNEEVIAAAQYQFPDGFDSIPQTFKDNIKYSLLEEKLISKEVESRTAYVIGFWMPPLSDRSVFTAEQNAVYDKQQEAGARALNEVLARLQHGETPLSIAKSIINNYPVLEDIITLNGYAVSSTSDLYLLNNPRVYTYQQQTDTKILFDTMFNSNVNDTKLVQYQDNSGGSVVKVIAVNHSQYKTFDAWLQNKIVDLVK